MRTFKWICTIQPDWEWLSGEQDGPGIPVSEFASLEGTVTLPPTDNYWFPCVSLVLQGQTYCHVLLHYHKDNGTDLVQARIQANGAWDEKGEDSTKYSSVSHGGVTLAVTMLNE